MSLSSPMSLDRWVHMLGEIYKNKNLNKSYYELLNLLYENISDLVKSIRKTNLKFFSTTSLRNKILQDISNIFCSFCCFIYKTDISLEQIVWRKYPGVCPYCHRSADCMCIFEIKHNVENTEINSQILSIPKSLHSWQIMISKIYGKANRLVTFETIVLHLIEEIGEAAKELRKNNFDQLYAELADCFVLIVGLYNRIEDINKFEIEQIIWNQYPNKCSLCKMNPCQINCIK